MARGALVAPQFLDEPSDKPLGLRVTQTALDRLDRVLAEEQKDPRNRRLSRAGVGTRILDLGLATYDARDAAGIERFRAVQAACGGDETAAIKELLLRGLESFEAEHGHRKKGGR